jgi:hypothetical protein
MSSVLLDKHVYLRYIRHFVCQGKSKVNILVKVKLSLTKYHAIKVYGRVEVSLHAFLTSAVDGNEL